LRRWYHNPKSCWLDNALKFTRPGDTIEVRAVEDGRVVTVEVADTGHP